MIHYKGPGDIFRLEVELKLCPVNTLGVMGNGLALAFTWKYPNVYKRYRELCQTKQFSADQILIVDGVVCFPTKREFYYDSKLEYIEANLRKLAKYCEDKKIKTLALPALGCGKGNLEFEAVERLVEDLLGPLETKVWFLTKRKGS